MTTFAIGDAHGNLDMIVKLLQQEGLMDGEGKRLQPDTHIVQLGDLANCVRDSVEDDLDCLHLIDAGLIDTLLIGNHEWPYFGGTPFNGFVHNMDIDISLKSLRGRGKIKPAELADDFLLTHAGLAESWDMYEYFNGRNVYDEIMKRWSDNPLDRLFNQVGELRGGWGDGGIFWSDYREPKEDIPQVFGHTPGDTVRIVDKCFCIDLGCAAHTSYRRANNRIAGAWINNDTVAIVVCEGEE